VTAFAIGTIQSLGGPLLILPTRAAANWSGGDGDGPYFQLLDDVSGNETVSWPAQDPVAVAWNIEGPGTTHVFEVGEEHYVLLKVASWENDDVTDGAVERSCADSMPPPGEPTGVLAVEHAGMLAFWAALDGPLAETDADGAALSAVRIPAPPGEYDVFVDRLEVPEADVQRMTIRRR
jgi:hypothetical protein